MGLCGGGKCHSKARLDGKTAIITGANSGIGKETAKDFYKRGGRVIVACRNLEKGNSAVEDIKSQCTETNGLGEFLVMELDLASLESVRNFAKQILEKEERINILLNNAGIMTCPQGKTKDGFEIQIGTNHLGHFLLTLLLLPLICKSTPARIVNVSSLFHKRGKMDFDDLNWEKRPYNSQGAYGQSKLANILFTKELAKKLEENNIKDVTVYALHPGVVNTELDRHLDNVYFPGATRIYHVLTGVFNKSPVQGAQTNIYCSLDEKCANETGLYYSDCAVASTSNEAKDLNSAEKLWDMSLEMVGFPENYNPFKSA